MDSEAKLACNVLSIVVVVSAILFNAVGLYILNVAKINKSNQIRIIVSLSVADILNCIGFITQLSVDLSGHTALQSKAGLVIWMFRAVLYHPWYTMFFLLTFDRFLACNFPFKYRSIFVGNAMRNLLIGIWIITMLPAPIYCFLDMEKIRIVYDVYVWVVLDAIFMFLFAVTYGSIYYRKKRSDLQFRHKDTNDDNHRFFIVTTAILVGFIFFAVVPDFTMSILITYAEETSNAAQPGFELWWNINMLIDPLIYVFLQKKVRDIALAKLRRCFRRCFRRLRRRSRSHGAESGNATCSSSIGAERKCDSKL